MAEIQNQNVSEIQNQNAFFVLETPSLEGDDFYGPAQNLEIYASNESFCESIHLPILNIMHSALQMAGSVEAVYVNVQHVACIRVKPDTVFYDAESSFQTMIAHVRRDGSYLNPDTNEVMLQLLPTRTQMLQELPENAIKIGCLSGAGTHASFREYLDTTSADHPLVIVVGDLRDGEVAGYVDVVTKVSGYILPTSMCLMRIVTALEEKFNIY